jgi:hypothetical protein
MNIPCADTGSGGHHLASAPRQSPNKQANRRRVIADLAKEQLEREKTNGVRAS